MKIQTRYFGEVQISEDEIVKFKQGLPGFNIEKEFVILPFSEEETPYHILQSVSTPSLAFVLGNPFVFFPDYEFELSESVTELLEIQSEKEVAVYIILTINEPFEKTTANLKAPVVINLNKGIGKQVVLNKEEYETKHFIMKEAVSKEGR
ncbi:flagellar assembly protein FliW [Pseudalkalibacillus sp. SCS-8]|uniref:flagellar assembly protein FliW n=1 Tax=Pseudalkalibacillus nanhaiensis TaxID=3115291 RepID=UPI0032DBBF62